MEPFLAPSVGELVAVRSFAGQDVVIFGAQADLLLHFPLEGRFMRFAAVDPALGELPGADWRDPLTNQNLPGGILKNSGDIRAKSDNLKFRHGGKPDPLSCKVKTVFFNPKTIFFFVAVVSLLWGGWLWRLWQPQRQVELHQRHLLDAVETRQWKRFDAMIADDFRTAGDYDKSTLSREAREFSRHFFVFMEITDHDTKVTLPEISDHTRPEAEVECVLTLDGKGSGLVDLIKEEVNSRKEPYRFRWRRQSWKPWDWQLIEAGHPLLEKYQGSF